MLYMYMCIFFYSVCLIILYHNLDIQIPEVAGHKHKKIAHGSELIEISYNRKEGRFLQVGSNPYFVN